MNLTENGIQMMIYLNMNLKLMKNLIYSKYYTNNVKFNKKYSILEQMGEWNFKKD